MKFSPPRFLADKKLYISDIQDGEVLEQRVESAEPWAGAPIERIQQRFESNKEALITQIVEGTRGWFSKPLTAQWLRAKCVVRVQSSEIPIAAGRSGTLKWKLTNLEISKDVFTLCWTLSEVLPDPVIELEEEEIAAPPPAEETGGGPGGEEDRAAQKERVLAARRRAARALYKAERLIQEYCALWGEDTDWEDEDSDASSGI